MISTCTGEVLIFIVRVTLYSRKLLRDRETFHDIHGLGAKSIATPTYVLESSNQQIFPPQISYFSPIFFFP